MFTFQSHCPVCNSQTTHQITHIFQDKEKGHSQSVQCKICEVIWGVATGESQDEFVANLAHRALP